MMRIVCINAKGVEDYMEVGEVFEVVMDKGTHWKVNTQKGVSIVVEKERFELALNVNSKSIEEVEVVEE